MGKRPPKIKKILQQKIEPIVFLFLTTFLLLLLVGFTWFWVKPARKPSLTVPAIKVATESGRGFSALLEKQKKTQQVKNAEQERQVAAIYGPCRWVPILLYHHIDNKPGWLYVDPTTFASQMGYLIQKGYAVITLPEVVAGLVSGGLPVKSAVLTFDDGYRDFYTQAYPVLKQKGLKATVFLITQLMEGDAYLTWQQAKEMVGSGLITIGDHTLSHRSLTSLPEDKIKDEIISSKSILESQLGVPINVFAYPYGSYNQTVIKYLTEGGFAAAVLSQGGTSCAKLPYGLRRIHIGRSSLSNYGL